MKEDQLAVIALTEQGTAIAKQLQSRFPEIHSYVFQSRNDYLEPKESEVVIENNWVYFSKLQELIPKLWETYQGIVCIMAAGIVVRQIAPYIQRKDCDPAVIVIDEKGEFVIPILSGHLGGGNALANKLAQGLRAQAVITTATDLQGLVAPDEYARQLGWKVYPLTTLPSVNRRFLERKRLRIYSEWILNKDHPLCQDSNYQFTLNQDEADIFISTSIRSTNCPIFTPEIREEKSITLIPPIHHVGIGCRRGVSTEEILDAINQVFDELGYSSLSIKGLYSISLKADEQGLLNAAKALKVRLHTFSPEVIQEMIESKTLTRSPWVKQSIGVDGVCEPASLLGCQNGQLIVPKTRVGKVTIAVCQEKSIS